ncbi:TVP38/TMEM64 family protein [Ectothiorhodospira sp. BSL-9]|uniref:TVP38/TMEM64 family protein n=1 Tax=Ectothiorhodospira sp. BSL-9 TaxID=1442136 RepID=UPI0007B43DD0|nr:TVP38/TMEM64 family protein [Ectothiorhodospira sp. BSL-9]ANB01802.1 hypothetical protein ECTOBSL9_1008 [Ectothiorhodospira sp. BSL-9]
MTGWNRQWLARGILIVVVAAVVTMGVLYRDALSVEAVRQQLDNLGAWAPIAFMAAYAVAAVAFLPGWIFTVAAGVLFGPIFGLIYALLGATLGATLAFLVARYTASDWVAEKAGGMVKRVMVGVEREGWRFVAFTRLVPLFPFNLLNYALGLTRINLMHYVAATLVCMIPGAMAYVWIGHAGAEAIAGGERAVQAVLIAIGLLAVAIFLPRLVKRIRREPVPGVDDPPEEGEAR